MSSILKALRKIDETSPSSPTVASLPEAIDAKDAVTREVKKRWFFRRWLTIVLVLLATAAAGIMLLHRRPLFLARLQPQTTNSAVMDSREKRPVFRSKMPAPPKKSVNAPSRAKPKPTADKPAKLGASPRQASAPGPRQSGATVPRTKPKATSGTHKGSLKTRSAFNPPAIAGKPLSRRRAMTPQTGRQPQKPARKKAAMVSRYDRLDNSALKLQALAWSPDAARRLVVINGHVIHEGESVEGYQVTRIRQEDVIVSDGRKSWRLVFGLQQ